MLNILADLDDHCHCMILVLVRLSSVYESLYNQKACKPQNSALMGLGKETRRFRRVQFITSSTLWP